MLKMISLKCQEMIEQSPPPPPPPPPQILLHLIDIQKRRADCKAIYFVHGIDKVNVHDGSSLGGLFSLY